MKHTTTFGPLAGVLLLFVLVLSCRKDVSKPDYANPYDEKSQAYVSTPGLNTAEVTQITGTSARSGGIFQNNFGKPASVKGVCWSTSQNPTTSASCTSDGASTTNYVSTITGLAIGTTYYVRAYATNEAGTTYGGQRTFTTPQLAVVTTGSASNITASSATVSATVTSDGGSSVTARGVCVSTTQNPTTADNCNSSGSGTGAYSVSLISLSGATTYFVRAYATNSAGTAYGSQVTFKTLDTLTDIDGNVYPIVQIGTQVWMAENLRTTRYRTGATITNVTNATTWSGLTTGAWVHYGNSTDNETVYGKLYNWYAVADSRNICPTGWHVPSDAEWTVLSNFLATDVGFKMKSTSGWQDNGNGSNASGFNGLPGGYRSTPGPFDLVGRLGYFWSSSEYLSGNAWGRLLSRDARDLGRLNDFKRRGFSVRCVQD